MGESKPSDWTTNVDTGGLGPDHYGQAKSPPRLRSRFTTSAHFCVYALVSRLIALVVIMLFRNPPGPEVSNAHNQTRPDHESRGSYPGKYPYTRYRNERATPPINVLIRTPDPP